MIMGLYSEQNPNHSPLQKLKGFKMLRQKQTKLDFDRKL